MKLAVVFLCLGISCLVDANDGKLQLKNLNEADARYFARTLINLCDQAAKLKTSPESERQARSACIIQGLISFLETLSVSVGCTLEQVLGLMGVSPDAARLMQENNSLALLEFLEIDDFLGLVLLFLEGLYANIGILLETVVLEEYKALDLETPIDSIIPKLHTSLEAVKASLIGSSLGNAFNFLGGGVFGGY